MKIDHSEESISANMEEGKKSEDGDESHDETVSKQSSNVY